MINHHLGLVTQSGVWRAASRVMLLVLAAFWSSGSFAQTQAEVQALADINVALSNFKATINAHTAAADLDYTHLLPYFDANFKHDGAVPNDTTAEFAESLRAGSISTISAAAIVSFATDANGSSKASTTGTVSATTVDGGFTQSWSPTNPDFSDVAWFYKPAGGTWKLYGNQEPGRIRVDAFIENRQSGNSCQGCDGTYKFVWFNAQIPQGQISTVAVTGPGYNATPLVLSGTQSKQLQASPAPAPKVSLFYQTFQLNGPAVADLPTPGSTYTFTLTPTTGQPFQVTRTVPQTTSQTIAFTSPSSHALADAKLGGALTLNWTLPTFPVQGIDLYVTTNSAAGMCNGPQTNNSLAGNATTFTLSPMPTQCLGQPIADNVSQGYPVQVVVTVTGTSGESTRAWYAFGTTSCNGGNSAPGSLTASSVAANLVQLQWDRACMPTTIANYGVWRSTSASGPFAKIGTTDLNTRSFGDTTVSSGTTYYYYVVATDTSANVSANSNQIAVTTTAGSGGGSATMNVVSGWNLLGNSSSGALNVAAVLNDKTKVTTVWKWVAATSKWAFYAPSLADGGAAYAAGKGYDFLTTVSGGEGFWVNAGAAFTAPLPAGTAVASSAFQLMASGWNLIAIGDGKTASQFNSALSITPPSPGVIPANLTTLWAWDAAQLNWYFYAPSLEANGGLAAYITSKSYLTFGTNPLGATTGFWVNKP